MTAPLVTVDVDPPVAVLELQRPGQRNAVSVALVDALEAAVDAINEDERVHAVVFAGAGPSFCAGADMTERLVSAEQSAQVFAAVRRASRAVHNIEVPVIAALHGHALGAGFELAAMCDYRIADRETLLGIPEVHQGITSGGGILAMASLLRRGALAKLAYGGERMDAVEAQRLGAVDEIVEDGDVRNRALEVARGFATSARAALMACKVALRAASEPHYDQQWQLLGLLQQSMEGGPAQREALERLRSERAARLADRA